MYLSKRGLNDKKKLEKLKSCIESELLPSDDVTFDQLKNLIIYGQSFANLETQLSTTGAMSQFDEAEIIFNVRKLDVSYEWTWDVECDVCAICRNDIVDSCMRCQADNCSKICPIGRGTRAGPSEPKNTSQN